MQILSFRGCLLVILVILTEIRQTQGEIMFTSQPTNVTVCEGESVRIDCMYHGTSAIPSWIIDVESFTWDRLPINHHYSFPLKALIIDHADMSMDGYTYQCILVNVRSSVGTLNVLTTALCQERTTANLGMIPTRVTSTSSYTIPRHSTFADSQSLTVTIKDSQGSRLTSPTVIPTNCLKCSQEFSVPVISGAVSGGFVILVLMTAVVLITTIFKFRQHLEKKKESSPVYEEPSFPDPIYEQIQHVEQQPNMTVLLEANQAYGNNRPKGRMAKYKANNCPQKASAADIGKTNSISMFECAAYQ